MYILKNQSYNLNMSKYHYNIEKKETKTNPGVINLTKVKKTETVNGGRKPSKISLRDLLIDTRDLLSTFMNEQHEVNKHQEEFNKMVFDQFKKHKWTK